MVGAACTAMHAQWCMWPPFGALDFHLPAWTCSISPHSLSCHSRPPSRLQSGQEASVTRASWQWKQAGHHFPAALDLPLSGWASEDQTSRLMRLVGVGWRVCPQPFLECMYGRPLCAYLAPVEVGRESKTLPGSKVAAGCESWCWCWEPNPGPLEGLFQSPEFLKFSGALVNPSPHQSPSLQPPFLISDLSPCVWCTPPTLVSSVVTDLSTQPLPQAGQFLPQPSLVPSCLVLLPSSSFKTWTTIWPPCYLQTPLAPCYLP